jgi:hypothetical protein
MESQQKIMNSYDLSAATDRFPLWFERETLRFLYKRRMGDSGNFARNWAELLEGLSFAFRKTPNAAYQVLTYGAGQPMGTYSSWASFAVSHHVIVQMAALRAGFPTPYVDYELLGDDIVLRGDTDLHAAVFAHYLELMESLGVNINPTKGVQSQNSTFEFAKRFVRGNDVLSSLRYKELSAVTSWLGLFNLILSMDRRGLPIPQIRVALEVGFVLINKVPFRRDLTDLRRVNLLNIRTFRVPLVLLTSPVGPYKVPLVAWLSGRGTFLVDFHPNLGHFINGIQRIIMEYEVQYPIAHGLKSVRERLVRSVLDAQSVSLGTLKSFWKTFHLSKPLGSGRSALAESTWKLLDANHINNALRSLDPTSIDNFGELLRKVGVSFSIKTDATREKGVKTSPTKLAAFSHRVPFMRYEVSKDYSNNLLIGLLRSIITISPARLVNVKALTELLGPEAIKSNLDADPDSLWVMPRERSSTFGSGTGLQERLARRAMSIVPKDFLHPSVLLEKFKGNICEFMKFSIDDILPSALPAHNNLVEVVQRAQGLAVLRAYSAILRVPDFEKDNLFTLPEMTDFSQAPTYMLTHTNGIRLDTKDPALCPEPRTLVAKPVALADRYCVPLVYLPRESHMKSFEKWIRGPKSTVLPAAMRLPMYPSVH